MAPVIAQPAPDVAQLLADVEHLSSDMMQGRRTGTEGNAEARAYLLAAFERIGLKKVGGSFEQPFTVRPRSEEPLTGTNLLGYVEGAQDPEVFLVVTAHYDHLGTRDGEVYNGADDNASGVAGLLAAAAHFSLHPPRHSILFALLDAEEMGLQGARALLAAPPVEQERMVLNVNMDMISRNAQDELYVSGTHPYPFLKPHLERVAERSSLTILFGHDNPADTTRQDWTTASDHGPFHQAGIPFVYFGVEDHKDYHRSTDDFENIDPDFFEAAVSSILDAIEELDSNLEEIRAQKEEGGP